MPPRCSTRLVLSEDSGLQRKYRNRVAIFAVLAVLTFVALGAFYTAVQTLDRLDAVERERDQWQRPADVMQELNLHEGNVVVDLGSGVGYFALKLSARVGKPGKVLAIDILHYPLWVLRSRAFIDRRHNIATILGEPDDPHLPASGVDAVLIANTYHELTNAKAILARLHRSLKYGGRLVILDHGARPDDQQSREYEVSHHEIAPREVEDEIVGAGFEVVKLEDHFIDRAKESHVWWLIVAQKP